MIFVADPRPQRTRRGRRPTVHTTARRRAATLPWIDEPLSGERIALQPQLLREDPQREHRRRRQVAASQPARLHRKPEEPFESAALDPARSLANATGMKIEGGADADQD